MFISIKWIVNLLNHFSVNEAQLSDGLVAISIEDSEKPVSNPITSPAQVKQDSEPLLPNKMCYEWKDITQEFFEAVKGRSIFVPNHASICITCASKCSIEFHVFIYFIFKFYVRLIFPSLFDVRF